MTIVRTAIVATVLFGAVAVSACSDESESDAAIPTASGETTIVSEQENGSEDGGEFRDPEDMEVESKVPSPEDRQRALMLGDRAAGVQGADGASDTR